MIFGENFQTFQGDFPTVAQSEKKQYSPVLLVLSVEKELHKMFAGKEKEAVVEQSKQNDCMVRGKFDQTFQGYFPTVAQSDKKQSAHAYFRIECSGKPKKNVRSRRVEAEVEQSNQNGCVSFEKVGQTFQGDFPTVAWSENNQISHDYLSVEC